MEYLDIGKLIGILISVIGTVAITFFNLSQSKRIRVELLEKLDDSIENGNKHTTCEIFRLLYGVRMNHSDITTLLNDENAIKIIYALRKTPGMVRYSNGEFIYQEIFDNEWVKLAGRLSSKAITYVLSSCLCLLAIASAATKDLSSLALFIIAIGVSVLLTAHLKQGSYNQMIRELVNKKI